MSSNPDDGLAPSENQDQFLNEERNVNEQLNANVENNEEEELEINNINEAYDNQAFVDLDEYINDDVVGSASSDDEFHSAEEENNFENNAPDVVEVSAEDHEGEADTKEQPKTKNEEGEDKRISDQNVHDLTLETSHSYMGENMEQLPGRTIHDDDQVVMMPLFFLPGVVLVPGQILPLNLFHPHPISMMRKVIAYDKTFGLMFGRNPEDSTQMATIGVSCEIFSVKEEAQRAFTTMSIKAEGRQRFYIVDRKVQLDGIIMGKVRILPEAKLPPCPPSGLLYTHYLHRNAIQSQRIANACRLQNNAGNSAQPRFLVGFNRKHIGMLYTSLSAYPGWVYKMYNPYFLMDCLQLEIRSWNQNIDLEMLPKDPLAFSYWITWNLPLTNEMKIDLLQIDCTAYRLRKQIELMTKCGSTLVCNHCSAKIADKNDLFSLSKRGPIGAYVNPHGHVHETVTFYKAQNVVLRGRSSEEYSWFPGYAWTVAYCDNCGSHLGWKFTTKKKLEPKKFWGLTRAALRPVFKEDRNVRRCSTCKKALDDDGSGEDTVLEERRAVDPEMIGNVQHESNI